MIEFKAECGHTVRARDDDAGRVTRCSYCGKSTQVPDDKSPELDFLVSAAEAASAADPPIAPANRGRVGRFGRRRSRTSFNPFSLILRLCWAALLVSVVIVIARLFVIPLWTDDGTGRSSTPASGSDRSASGASGAGSATPRKPLHDVPKAGFLRSQGLSVVSTPAGATVYFVASADAPPRGRIHRCKGATEFRAGGEPPRPPDGSYVVEVVFPWNDPALKRYAGYPEFRRQIESMSESQRNALATEYFLPDEASTVFVDQSEEQKYIVRQYRGIDVREGRSGGVRALFLPRIASGTDGSFSIEQLILGQYLPETVAYPFDENHVRSELEYYRVPERDQSFVLTALSRIGVMPYRAEDRRTLLFKISAEDGSFSVKLLSEPGK